MICVGQVSSHLAIDKSTDEAIQERNHTNVNAVIEALDSTLTYKNTYAFTLEKNGTGVRFVVEGLHVAARSKIIRGFIQEKDLTPVTNAGKVLLGNTPWMFTIDNILEKSHTGVSSVEKPFIAPLV